MMTECMDMKHIEMLPEKRFIALGLVGGALLMGGVIGLVTTAEDSPEQLQNSETVGKVSGPVQELQIENASNFAPDDDGKIENPTRLATHN